MKHQMWKAVSIVVLATMIAGSVAWAEGGATAPAKGEPSAVTSAPAELAAPAPAPHQELFWPSAMQFLHHPMPWLDMGLDFRFRVTGGENWQTLNEDSATDNKWSFQRYRWRWWTKWVLSEDISFNTRLAWEFRTWQRPEAKTRFANPEYPRFPGASVTEFNPDEALFDWFNVNLRNLGGLPLTATLGRQDMIFGVGWLVRDGTPLDDSRTIYFDAARFTYDWAGIDTKIDLVYVDQTAKSDRWLKPINDQDRGVTEQDEHGAILYLTNTSWKPVQFEGFFIYRNDNPVNESLSNFPYVWSRKAEIYTFGAAVSGTQGDHWKYRAEAALQRGNKSKPGTTLGTVGENQHLEAYGTLNTLEYQFKDPHDNATHITYEYASGDNPDTAENEEFDLLWGEWPRWSELFFYTYANETQPGAGTNLHRLNLGHRFNVNKQWTVTADWNLLWADQNRDPVMSGPNGINISPDGKFRGHLLATWLRYRFSDQLYGHFLAEYFINGDGFYMPPSDDNAYFLRFNLEYIF